MQHLVDDIAAACKRILSVENISIKDRRRTIFDDDGSGLFLLDVGRFHEYHIGSFEKRRFFGRSWLEYHRCRPLVRLGAEELFGARHLYKPWCAVYDAHLVEAVRPMMESFAHFQNAQLQFSFIKK